MGTDTPKEIRSRGSPPPAGPAHRGLFCRFPKNVGAGVPRARQPCHRPALQAARRLGGKGQPTTLHTGTAPRPPGLVAPLHPLNQRRQCGGGAATAGAKAMPARGSPQHGPGLKEGVGGDILVDGRGTNSPDPGPLQSAPPTIPAAGALLPSAGWLRHCARAQLQLSRCVPPTPGPLVTRLSPVCKSSLGPPAHAQQGQHEESALPVTEASSVGSW